MAINKPSNVGDEPSGTVSQAQSTSGEAAHRKAQAPNTKSQGAAGADTEIQYFDGTVTKVDKDGNVVMSDHLAPGERLEREVDAEKEEKQRETERKEAEKRDNK